MNATNPAGDRRLMPRIWRDHDWHVMRQLRSAIEHLLDHAAGLKAGQRVVDLGCGDRPYAPLLAERGAVYVACDLEGPVDIRIEAGRPLDLTWTGTSANASGCSSRAGGSCSRRTGRGCITRTRPTFAAGPAMA
jgi:hypothetical protein